jgi:hypothetical protein
MLNTPSISSDSMTPWIEPLYELREHHCLLEQMIEVEAVVS